LTCGLNNGVSIGQNLLNHYNLMIGFMRWN
jgi:hypothetical protein